MLLASAKRAIYWSVVVGLIGVLVALVYVDRLPPTVKTLTSVRYILRQWLGELSPELTVDNLAAEYRKGCPAHKFTSVRILSREPSMMLIEGFLTDVEAEFLVKIA
jgi:hypothetical protein